MAEYPALDLSFPADGDTSGLIDLLHAALDDFAPLAIHEHETAGAWRVFFRDPRRRAAAAGALARRFTDRGLRAVSIDVADEGWARRSQAQLTAVRVGRLVVAPPWAAADVPAGCTLVVIDPSTGFGTGHHATTRLCLSLLQTVDPVGRVVVDVGTGSGVLAIAAVTLGARRAEAVDCDPDALANARANVARNGVGRSVRVVDADLSGLAPRPADLVLANLTASVLEREAPRLVRLATPPAQLIVSGFTPSDVPGIETAFGCRARTTLDEDGWAAALFEPPPRPDVPSTRAPR